MIDRRNRSTVIPAATTALVLVALACTCGPLQTVQHAQSTIGAVQATVAPALTAYKENEPTLNAMMTDLQQNAPTYEAYLTQVGGPGFSDTMNAIVPGFDATMTAVSGGGGSGTSVSEDYLVHQWASSASASSQYGDSDWSASQATGAPDTQGCGDHTTAWASGTPNERATLTVTYDRPVIPLRIAITHSYYPTSVVQVDVVDVSGHSTTVRTQPPLLTNVCPFTEIISVNGVTAKVSTVIITVDQGQIGQWDEIDAVELVGIP